MIQIGNKQKAGADTDHVKVVISYKVKLSTFT